MNFFIVLMIESRGVLEVPNAAPILCNIPGYLLAAAKTELIIISESDGCVTRLQTPHKSPIKYLVNEDNQLFTICYNGLLVRWDIMSKGSLRVNDSVEVTRTVTAVHLHKGFLYLGLESSFLALKVQEWSPKLTKTKIRHHDYHMADISCIFATNNETVVTGDLDGIINLVAVENLNFTDSLLNEEEQDLQDSKDTALLMTQPFQDGICSFHDLGTETLYVFTDTEMLIALNKDDLEVIRKPESKIKNHPAIQTEGCFGRLIGFLNRNQILASSCDGNLALFDPHTVKCQILPKFHNDLVR